MPDTRCMSHVLEVKTTPRTANLMLDGGAYTFAGWYADRGLDVTFLSPHSDGYKTTPAQQLSFREADLAVTPTETVISSATQPANSDKPRLKVRSGSTHRACFDIRARSTRLCVPETMTSWLIFEPLWPNER